MDNSNGESSNRRNIDTDTLSEVVSMVRGLTQAQAEATLKQNQLMTKIAALRAERAAEANLPPPPPLTQGVLFVPPPPPPYEPPQNPQPVQQEASVYQVYRP